MLFFLPAPGENPEAAVSVVPEIGDRIPGVSPSTGPDDEKPSMHIHDIERY